jgi:hypothetical protein
VDLVVSLKPAAAAATYRALAAELARLLGRMLPGAEPRS